MRSRLNRAIRSGTTGIAVVQCGAHVAVTRELLAAPLAHLPDATRIEVSESFRERYRRLDLPLQRPRFNGITSFHLVGSDRSLPCRASVGNRGAFLSSHCKMTLHWMYPSVFLDAGGGRIHRLATRKRASYDAGLTSCMRTSSLPATSPEVDQNA
jgi:hypothetical protein